MVRKWGDSCARIYRCPYGNDIAHSVFQSQRFVACLSSSVLFIHCIHLLSHPCEFPTFRTWFWFLPFSWVILFLSGISLPSAWQKCCPSDLYLVPGPSVRAQASLSLRWGQLVWTPKRTKYGSGKEERAQGHLPIDLPFVTGNTPSHLIFPSFTPAFPVHRRIDQEQLLKSFQNACVCHCFCLTSLL